MAAASASSLDALTRVIDDCEAVPCGDGKWKGTCPICKHQCLLIEKGDKQPVAAWCSRECDKKKVNAALYKVAGFKRAPFNVARFCELKKLPLAWAEAHFLLHDGIYQNEKTGKASKCISFPYLGAVKVTRTDASESYLRPSGGTKCRFSEDSHVTAWQNYSPMLYGLHLFDAYYAPNGVDTSTVTLVEGESDTITLAYNDIPVLGISGAPHGWKAEYASLPPLANAKRIFIVQEPDEAGRKLVQKVAASFPAGKVCALLLPAKDPSALWINGTPEQFKKAWEQAVAKALPVVLPAPDDYIVERLSDIVPKPLLWLWPGRIPQAKLTVFAGNPGVGKGLATCSVAAIVTTGSIFPDEDISDHEPADVCMLFCEDDAEDTVVPRLMAAGADLERIYRIKAPSIVKAGPNATHGERELALDSDLKILRKFLADHPGVKLVIVDPISSYFGPKVKPNDETQVRSVLIPLRELAQETGVTFVLVAHFNKRSDVSALHKILGAVAMTGVARAAWMFAQDMEAEEQGEEKYLMLQGKLNVGRKMKGLEYTFGEKQILPKPADATAYVVWGEATDKTAEKALGSVGAFGDAEGSKLKQAGDWLRQHLGDVAKLAREVFTAAGAAGIAEKTLRRAKDELGVVVSKTPAGWQWRMPSSCGPDDPL